MWGPPCSYRLQSQMCLKLLELSWDHSWPWLSFSPLNLGSKWLKICAQLMASAQKEFTVLDRWKTCGKHVENMWKTCGNSANGFAIRETWNSLDSPRIFEPSPLLKRSALRWQPGLSQIQWVPSIGLNFVYIGLGLDSFPFGLQITLLMLMFDNKDPVLKTGSVRLTV